MPSSPLRRPGVERMRRHFSTLAKICRLGAVVGALLLLARFALFSLIMLTFAGEDWALLSVWIGGNLIFGLGGYLRARQLALVAGGRGVALKGVAQGVAVWTALCLLVCLLALGVIFCVPYLFAGMPRT